MHSLALTHPHTHVGVSLALIFSTCIYFPFVINCSHVVQNFSCRPFDNFVVCGKSSNSFFVLLISIYRFEFAHNITRPALAHNEQSCRRAAGCFSSYVLNGRACHPREPVPFISFPPLHPSCAFCTIYETCALLVPAPRRALHAGLQLIEEQIRSRVDHCPRFRESHRSLPLRPFAA